MNSYQQICKTFPANKFRPPRLHPKQILKRSQLTNNPRIYPDAILPKILFIEAQAGQGKTTLAFQWLERVNMPHIWYQTGEEDKDPIFFYSGLLAAITRINPFLQSSPLMEMLNNGEVGALELQGCITALFRELAEHCLTKDFVLVLDDLHLAHTSPKSLAFLDKWLQASPFFMHFILISRRPLDIDALTSDSHLEVIHLTNGDLALSSMETMVLLQDILDIPVTWQNVLDLHQRTNGWIMGVLLASQMFPSGKKEIASIPLQHSKEYFQNEILDHIPKEQKRTLLKISFLDEIDPVFARKITGEYDIEEILENLVHTNCFVHVRGTEKKRFSLHHLFQEFLQDIAHQELSPRTIETILEEAGEFCLTNGRIEKSLSYFLQAGNGEASENVLRQKGMELLAGNRQTTLLFILQNLPEQFVNDHLWIRLYIALVTLDTDPADTLPTLYDIMEEFSKKGDETGVLTTGSQIIFGHIVYSALYEKGTLLLPRMKALFEQTKDSLSPHSKLMIAKNLALASTLMAGDVIAAGKFSDLALSLAREHNIKNHMAATLLSKGYEYLLPGYKEETLRTAEQAYAYISHSSVSLIHHCTLLTLLHNVCFEGSDATNTARHRSLILQTFGIKALKQTMIGSSLLIWDISMAITAGRNKQAAQLLTQLNEQGSCSSAPHVRSQFLQWQAYLAAHNGDHEKTVEAGNESLRLRKIAGGPFFIIRNLMILGGSHTLIKSYDTADTFLSQAMQLAKTHNYPSHIAALSIHRGFLFMQTGQEDTAKEVILSGLAMMRKNGYTCFMSWSPSIVLPVLQFAVDKDIEKEYALFLAKEQMQLSLQKQDAPIPLLSIALFGGIQLSIEKDTIARSNDLTPAWRQILTVLILSKNQQMTSRALQTSLWPEKSPEKARRALDTQLSRLKKFLSQDCLVNNYLTSSKGIITLRHCKVDIHDFINFAEQGLTHIDQLEWWQAENSFHNAIQLWDTGGAFDPELLGGEQAWTQKIQLNNLYIRMVLLWSKHLHGTRRKTEARELLEKGISHYPDHVDLVTALFSLHLQNNNSPQAQNVLDQFTHFLHLKKYSDQEIQIIRTNILVHVETA